ncbi:MAG: helicase C-terminal domain-containing protein [Candidatus Heimdallarchaeaceae archaeon]
MTLIFEKIKFLELEKEVLGFYPQTTRPTTGYEGITLHRNIKEVYLENTQFLLFSATVIDAKEVIYDLLNIDGVKIQSTQKYYNDSRERLQRISILSAVDLPRLGKSNLDEYNRNIEVTLNFLTDILRILEDSNILNRHNILVLCNSLADANKLRSHISKTSLKDRILDVDKIQQKYEVELGGSEDDAIATMVGEEIAKILKTETKIILVTGSSVFWQGINLDNIHFLFVLTLPYRKPTIKELKSKRKGWAGYYSGASQFKYMVRRLSQGIGRLCRKDWYDKEKKIKNWGITVILDGRLDTIKTGVIRNFPEIFRSQFSFFTRDQLRRGIIKAVNWIVKYDSPYSKDGQLKLTEFFG